MDLSFFSKSLPFNTFVPGFAGGTLPERVTAPTLLPLRTALIFTIHVPLLPLVVYNEFSNFVYESQRVDNARCFTERIERSFFINFFEYHDTHT